MSRMNHPEIKKIRRLLREKDKAKAPVVPVAPWVQVPSKYGLKFKSVAQ